MVTAHPRRFRFGVELMAPFDGLSWVDSARELESLGYSTLFVPDHFHEGYGPITAMATAAMATTTLKVAPMVLACDFRHPAVLARELASIDVLSGGRLEVGLGAGYNPLDYSRSGIRHDPPGARVDRLIEHVAVLRGLFADAQFSFAGEHYRIDDLDGTPKPHASGGPPILVAGGGRRMLTFAARHADIVGLNVHLPSSPGEASARDALPASMEAKVALVREAAGERFAALELNAWISVARVTDDLGRLGNRLSARFGAPVDEVLRSPLVLVGSAAEIADEVLARRERWGYSYVCLPQDQAHAFAPIVRRLTGT
ncbi:MAG: TIGR03621 family F420-dependent LLM class oxidoreductase [Ilumatobacteraceae bacterium]